MAFRVLAQGIQNRPSGRNTAHWWTLRGVRQGVR
nr:MAG TPA: hypothetical protein [Caudoviricetes sp.]